MSRAETECDRRLSQFPTVDLMLLIHRFEEISARAEEAFCVPHQEEAGRIQGVVKDGEHSLLQRRAQINENVAATDQVHPGKWRGHKKILRPKKQPDHDR